MEVAAVTLTLTVGWPGSAVHEETRTIAMYLNNLESMLYGIPTTQSSQVHGMAEEDKCM